MLSFDIRSNASVVTAQLTDLQKKHLPKARMNATNKLGAVIHTILRKEMEESFDRPTPYTLRGMRYKLATEGNPVVRIWLEEFADKGIPPAKYLAPQIDGGTRRHKRFERALIEKGLMSPVAYAVPGRQAPLDAYGNVPGPFIVRMLSDLQAFAEGGYRANRKGARKGRRKTNYFFVPRPGSSLKPGVYWHMPGGLVGVVFAFVSKPSYRRRFDFYGKGNRAFDRYAGRFMTEALANLVRLDNKP